MVKFVVLYNGEPLKTYELDDTVFSIGRLPENTISIANMGISRRHAKIEEDADRKHILNDLNSLNGTYVNGKRVKKIALSSGDKITIGKYTILYELVSDSNYDGISEAGQNVQTPVPDPVFRVIPVKLLFLNQHCLLWRGKRK